jgi:hypothetical protein
LCERFDEIEAQAKALSELYRLRSRLIHGRIGQRDFEDAQWQVLPGGRILLRTITIAALKLAQAHRADALPTMLTQASADPDAFDVLRQSLV